MKKSKRHSNLQVLSENIVNHNNRRAVNFLCRFQSTVSILFSIVVGESKIRAKEIYHNVNRNERQTRDH